MNNTTTTGLWPDQTETGQMALTPKYTDDIDKHVGAKIRAKRLQLGMSMQDIAPHLGVTWQQLWKYEVGDNRVSASRLARIAYALDTPIVWFFPPEFGGDEMPVIPNRKEQRERAEYERLSAKFGTSPPA